MKSTYAFLAAAAIVIPPIAARAQNSAGDAIPSSVYYEMGKELWARGEAEVASRQQGPVIRHCTVGTIAGCKIGQSSIGPAVTELLTETSAALPIGLKQFERDDCTVMPNLTSLLSGKPCPR